MSSPIFLYFKDSLDRLSHKKGDTMSAWHDLTQVDQRSIKDYICLVQRWVDLNDPDSKNMLREVTTKIAKHAISKTYPAIQTLTTAVFAYLKETEDCANSIDNIQRIIAAMNLGQ